MLACLVITLHLSCFRLRASSLLSLEHEGVNYNSRSYGGSQANSTSVAMVNKNTHVLSPFSNR